MMRARGQPGISETPIATVSTVGRRGEMGEAERLPPLPAGHVDVGEMQRRQTEDRRQQAEAYVAHVTPPRSGRPR